MCSATDTEELVRWSKRFETGLAEIDAQHKHLVEIVNTLARLSITDLGWNAVDSILAELRTHFVLHSETEERLMHRYQFAPQEIAAHCDEHTLLIAGVDKLKGSQERSAGASQAISLLLSFLTRWLVRHILEYDMEMAHQVLALEAGKGRKEAQAEAASKRFENSQVLVDALCEVIDNLALRSSQLATSLSERYLSDARYALAQQAAGIASWELDLATRNFAWSSEADGLLGRKPGEQGRDFRSFMGAVHPEDRHLIEAGVTAVNNGRLEYDVQHRVVWPDGSVHWIAATGRMVTSPEGPQVLAGIARDVTAERTDQESLQETNRQLSLSLASLENHATDLVRLHDLSESLQSCLSANEAYEMVAHLLGRLNLGSSGALSIVTPPTGDLFRAATWGAPSNMLPSCPAAACWAMRRGVRHSVVSAEDGPWCKHFDTLPAYGYLCQPLLVLGEPLGLLTIEAPAHCSATEWSRIQHLVSLVAESLKLALSNITLREALHEQAIRDPLTGLLNRRYLSETLPRELHRAQRELRPLSIAMLDLDHFKQLNDTWGHEAGDMVLIEFARIIQQQLRASDLACRFGGEEFVLVLPGAEIEEALARLDDIATRMREANLRSPAGYLPQVSFSAGIAQAFIHGESQDALLRSADRALYAAKEAGRNRILVSAVENLE